MIPGNTHFAIIKHPIGGIGSLLIIIKVMARTIHRYPLGIIHRQTPTGYIQKVRSIVLNFATAVMPMPVPVIMHQIILVGTFRAWPLPFFPAVLAHPIGHLHKLTLADATPTPVVPTTGIEWFSNLTGLHPFNPFNDPGLTAALITHLHLFLILTGSRHD